MARIVMTSLPLVMLLAGCWGEELEPPKEIIRGLKTHIVTETEVSMVRRFPSVLQPSDLTTLSFEVPGSLQQVNLSIGQVVSEGDVLAQLDPTSLEIQLENTLAVVNQAKAEHENATNTLERRRTLLERGAVTQVAVDNAKTEFLASQAALNQAQQMAEAARTDLTKTTLHAPFAGVVNSVSANSYATVGAGVPIATLYAPDQFEASFSVNFETAGQMVVGTPARLRLADVPTTRVEGVVTELGQRADAVSAYPVVVSLTDADPLLKAGMAVEVELEFPLPQTEGFLLPMSTISPDLSTVEDPAKNRDEDFVVYVFDPTSGTVNQRKIEVSGVRGNSLIVTDGLSAGEHVASAGVSFLRHGQKVRLLKAEGE
ncbi:efflux RND transporter periplasmic adaptor subunit [Shimia sediminis]|uniref:efflux RND transporter periplasmic adaptor subunit n=1 Tax=Shimia sediminis TaxID=2497945 RepID=UPI0013DF4237|nr:efflux RND transporter periplasmic adaptor subunit [Shimia sediminis]